MGVVHFPKESGEIDVEVTIHVIHDTSNSAKITAQYILFCQLFNEQRSEYGYTEKAILETLRICKERNILVEYIEKRESEIMNIMKHVMDQKKASELHDRDTREKGREEGREEGKEEERLKNIERMAHVFFKKSFSIEECLESIIDEYDDVNSEIITKIVNKVYFNE